MIRRTLLVLGLCLASAAVSAQDCVVLLHGLARSADSMDVLEARLTEAGYGVVNQDYPSRSASVDELAMTYVSLALQSCREKEAQRIHVVTHSMGGILTRYYLREDSIPELGHVVMLAPPNQGSEVVDNWRKVPGFGWLNGEAGKQLGTDDDSVPRQLGPVEFSLGVIAGTRTMNPLLSLSLPNPDDGKVSVESTKVEGMADHIEVPHTHTFLMRADTVIEQTLHFLKFGRFRRESSQPTSDG